MVLRNNIHPNVYFLILAFVGLISAILKLNYLNLVDRSIITVTEQDTFTQDNPNCKISNRPEFDIMNFFGSKTSKNEDWKNATSVYDFTVKDIDDQEVKLDKYRGKVLLIVNVASKCGLTKTNYKELNDLYSKHKDRGLAILGFPSNSFAQEPGCNIDIKEFIKKNNVEWDMFSKIDVNGDSADPLYKWLKTKCGGTLIDAIKWNFTKFLVDKNGQPVGRFAPQKNPSELDADIQAELEK